MAIDATGSLIGTDGKVRHFGREAFATLASDTDRCFVCGISSADASFNNEHVVPDWLLRRFGLHSRHITLPNGRQLMYGRYTLRCCRVCNSILGQRIETPISRLFVDDFLATAHNLQTEPTLLYQWLCLLFIKLHLRDREIRVHPDPRRESGAIAESYDWDGLHHVHSVARTAHSGASIDDDVIGTILIFEVNPTEESFDLGALYDYRTILVRIGTVGIASVLNDAALVGPMVRGYLSGISGPLSPIQLREVAARLAYGNQLLLDRPRFWSELEHETKLAIRASRPRTVRRADIVRAELGSIIAYSCEALLRKSRTSNLDEKVRQLRQGEIQFLYHDDGSFIVE
jgi:hypothetical protein